MKIMKSLFTENEYNQLRPFIFNEFEETFIVKNSDLESFFEKYFEISEDQSTSPEQKSYIIKTSSYILTTLKDYKEQLTFTEKMSTISAINSLYYVSPREADKLLNILKSMS